MEKSLHLQERGKNMSLAPGGGSIAKSSLVTYSGTQCLRGSIEQRTAENNHLLTLNQKTNNVTGNK